MEELSVVNWSGGYRPSENISDGLFFSTFLYLGFGIMKLAKRKSEMRYCVLVVKYAVYEAYNDKMSRDTN